MTYRKLSILALVALAVLVALPLAACGGEDQDISAGLTQAQVEEIVREELADAPAPPEPAPGLTAADVEEAIRAAIAEMPSRNPDSPPQKPSASPASSPPSRPSPPRRVHPVLY